MEISIGRRHDQWKQLLFTSTQRKANNRNNNDDHHLRRMKAINPSRHNYNCKVYFRITYIDATLHVFQL